MTAFVIGALVVCIIVIPAFVLTLAGFKYRREIHREREQEQQARDSLYPKVGGWRT